MDRFQSLHFNKVRFMNGIRDLEKEYDTRARLRRQEHLSHIFATTLYSVVHRWDEVEVERSRCNSQDGHVK